MASNASRGAAAKAKTKKWLIARGYQVGNLEETRIIWIPAKEDRPARQIPQKRDQFGSDLLAVNGAGVIFVQAKSGAAASGGTFPAARSEFEQFTFPASARRLIIAWPPRARAPRVLEVFGDDSFCEIDERGVAEWS